MSDKPIRHKDWACNVQFDAFTGEKYIVLKTYVGKDKNIHVPAQIENIPVRDIQPTALIRVKSTTESITFDKECSIENIPECFCKDCKNLKTVALPDNIKRIKKDAFAHCEILTKINKPKNLQYIGVRAFYHCTNLEDIPVPDGLKSIDMYAFAKCKCPFMVTLPATLEQLKAGAFINAGMASADLSHTKIKCIPDSLFSGCDVLISVKLNPFTESIGQYAFNDCSELRTVVNTRNVTHISDFAFANCFSLLYLHLKNLENISQGNFGESSHLKIRTTEKAKNLILSNKLLNPSQIELDTGSRLRAAVHTANDGHDER